MSDNTNLNCTDSEGANESGEEMSLAVKVALGAVFGVVAYKTAKQIVTFPRRVQLARRRVESERRVKHIRESYGNYL